MTEIAHSPASDAQEPADGAAATPAPTLRGSCRCGQTAFEVELDLSAGTTQCSCTFCRKNGWWGTIVKPDRFRLVRGTEEGRGNRWVRCPHCQTLVFSRGDLPQLGGPFVSVSVRALDDVSLDGVPIAYLDGAANTWELRGQAAHVDPFKG